MLVFASILSFLPAEIVIPIISSIIGLFKGISFIKEGELGVKLRFGKAVRTNGQPKIYEPGFIFMIPFADKLVRYPVRQQTVELDEQEILLACGKTFKISAAILFRVNDVYKVLFEIRDLVSSLDNIAKGVLREVIQKKKYQELAQVEEIAEEIFKDLKTMTESWGIDLKSVKLTNCAPTANSEQLILTITGLSAKLEALAEALKTQNLGTISSINPMVIAALVGVPAVTSISSNSHSSTGKKDTE